MRAAGPGGLQSQGGQERLPFSLLPLAEAISTDRNASSGASQFPGPAPSFPWSPWVLNLLPKKIHSLLTIRAVPHQNDCTGGSEVPMRGGMEQKGLLV